MAKRPDGLIDEAILRRALRLEADEPTPRFDSAAIAAMARPRITPRLLLAGALASVAVALMATAVWATALLNSAALVGDGLGLLVDAIAYLAQVAYPIAQAMGDPAIPLSLLAGIGIAIYHETRMRRGHAHAEAA